MPKLQLKHLYDTLQEDTWRLQHPFSKDVAQAHDLLHRPYARREEIQEVMSLWLQKHQPCNFGRIAAKYGFIHMCVLTDRDLLRSDDEIKNTIQEEKRLWKQRAFQDRKNPPHGFLLVIASERIAMAAPDFQLQRFSDHLLGLTGWKPMRRQEGTVSSDFLWLQHPEEPYAYGYQFNVDYFASAGDGRWWHDHRVPGGIALTANSTGHMKAFQEWYMAKTPEDKDRGAWFVQQAMYTVAQAHRTSDDKAAEPQTTGAVTWLRDLDQGKPLKNHASPLNERLPVALQGKDWTTYEGVLHTDLAVRPEFFDGRQTPSTASKPYYQDLTYLFDRASADYLKFTGGVRRSREEVFQEIGKPESWVYRSAPPARATAPSDQPARSSQEEAVVRTTLDVCRSWKTDPSLLDADPSL